MMMMLSANNLIALYVGLELQSWRSTSLPPSSAIPNARPKPA